MIQYILLSIAVIAILFAALTRILNYMREEDKSSGMTTKVIAFTTIVLSFVVVGVLGLQEVIPSSATESLLGAIIGYTLSEVEL